MKKHFTKILTVIMILALICCLIPTFTKRINVEKENKTVVVSLYYNDLANKLRGEKLDDAIEEFKKVGVTTMSFSEESINSMVARGDVTNIKHNVLRHKFDDESLELARLIEEQVPEVIYDSQLLITKDDETAKALSVNLPDRFIENKEYKKIEYTNPDTGITTTVFCIFDGTLPTNDVLLGYNENTIKKYSDAGFDICLVLRLFDNTQTGYIDRIEQMINDYNIKFVSIRSALVKPENESDAKEHYTRISELIDKYNLTLVITENPDQLSNEAPFGYNHIFDNNNSKVLRSYETYDASQADSSHYQFRYRQYLNSTIDRNIRFITVSQIHLQYTSFEKCTEYTIKAVDEYIKQIKELGYTVNGEVPELEYDTSLELPNAISVAIMVLMVYLIFCIITNKNSTKLFIAAIILAILGAGAGYIMPAALHWAFPTAWAVMAPCFALTVVLYLIKKTKDKIGAIPMAILAVVAIAGIMSLLGIVQSSLLSGINYYVNNDIFRGIKLSLFVPLLYALVIYILMFSEIDYKKLVKKASEYKLSDIKLVWIVALLIIGLVGYGIISIYIRRSGNVNSISSLESWMRNSITDIFEARPRTKEFLIGYPCLVLFVYYLKKTNIKLIQGALFCGAAITAASISNSFCHVFTTVEIIYGRVLNGIIIGALFCVAAYIVNLVFVKIISKLFNSYILPKLSPNGDLYSLYKTITGERK